MQVLRGKRAGLCLLARRIAEPMSLCRSSTYSATVGSKVCDDLPNQPSSFTSAGIAVSNNGSISLAEASDCW